MSSIGNPELLAVIRAYCGARGMSKSAFGMAAVGDPGFVSGLEKGREPRTRVVARVHDYITTGRTWRELRDAQVAA